MKEYFRLPFQCDQFETYLDLVVSEAGIVRLYVLRDGLSVVGLTRVLALTVYVSTMVFGDEVMLSSL